MIAQVANNSRRMVLEMTDMTPSEYEQLLRQSRSFLKDSTRKIMDFTRTDQSLGIEAPPIEKPCQPDARRVDLPGPSQWNIPPKSVEDAILNRSSRRDYAQEPLSIEEIAFLLWATQGVRELAPSGRVFRTVPSAGCRHAFETYLAALDVEGLDGGIYRYLPTTHQLVFEFSVDNLPARLTEAALGQRFCGSAAAVFIWTAIPYRMEWRYGLATHTHKVIALDAGHVCQNLYLACEAISAGTCAVAAYDQAAFDDLLKVDGEDEFVVYLAPVGRTIPR